MKITFVLADGFTLAGGQRVVAIHANELRRRGHIVHVVARPAPPLSWRERWHRRPFLRGAPSPSHFDGLDVPRRQLDSVRPVVDADLPDADIVVATWWETAEWVARLSPSKGAKVHFIQHHEVFDYVPRHRAEAVYRLPFHKIVVAPWLQRVMREQYGVGDVAIVTNGVDTGQFHAEARGKQRLPTVGMLYSSIPWKGWEIGMRALTGVRQQLPQTRLVAYGEHAPRRGLLPANAEFHRCPAQSDLREIYSRCDVWMCGSWTEGFHLPLLEAMACRCPVVSTRVGGAPETIEEGVNGHLVDPGDAEALADRLVHVLTRPEVEWRALSAAALATAQRHTWAKATDDFEAALHRAISHRRDAETQR